MPAPITFTSSRIRNPLPRFCILSNIRCPIQTRLVKICRTSDNLIKYSHQRAPSPPPPKKLLQKHKPLLASETYGPRFSTDACQVYSYHKMHHPYKSDEDRTSNNLDMPIKGHLLPKILTCS